MERKKLAIICSKFWGRGRPNALNSTPYIHLLNHVTKTGEHNSVLAALFLMALNHYVILSKDEIGALGVKLQAL
jgi:hypothetical protein